MIIALKLFYSWLGAEIVKIDNRLKIWLFTVLQKEVVVVVVGGKCVLATPCQAMATKTCCHI
jgi:hypothetical protein